MARKRNPLRDEAYRIWIESDKKRLLKSIAEEIGVTASTVRKWKSEDKWGGDSKRSAPNEKVRYDSMRNNQNAKGNSGGGAPARNQNAVSHGLFAKHLPAETSEILEALTECDPVDILWDNIRIQYTAIIRSQKIMYVSDQEDISREESGWSSGKTSSSTMALQYAWDKQANFLNAQSRAISTLNNSIKQFVAIADEEDERRKKLELMSVQIRKAESEARILENTADKLTAGGKGNELLQALLDVKTGGNVNGDPVQPETDSKH